MICRCFLPQYINSQSTPVTHLRKKKPHLSRNNSQTLSYIMELWHLKIDICKPDILTSHSIVHTATFMTCSKVNQQKASLHIQILKVLNNSTIKTNPKPKSLSQSTFWLPHKQIFFKNYTAIFSPDCDKQMPVLSVVLFPSIFLKMVSLHCAPWTTYMIHLV